MSQMSSHFVKACEEMVFEKNPWCYERLWQDAKFWRKICPPDENQIYSNFGKENFKNACKILKMSFWNTFMKASKKMLQKSQFLGRKWVQVSNIYV